MKISKINNNRCNVNFTMGTYLHKQSFHTRNSNFSDGDKVSLNRIKPLLYEKLKNEEVLYDLYSGRDINIPQEILSNKEFLLEMYQDPDFMRASNLALLKITQDKLENDELSKKNKRQLLILKHFFTAQELLFDSKENNFQVGVNEIAKKREDRNARQPQLIMQPTFGSIFNYGVFNKPRTRKERAEAIVNRAATMAATKTVALTLTPFEKVDKLKKVIKFTRALEPAALTATTIKMCREICKTYQMPGTAITALISRISGQLAGKVLGNALREFVVSFVPVAGDIANATVTYSLHQMQGRAIIEWCEKNYKNPDISDWDKIATGFNILRLTDSIIPTPSLDGDITDYL